MSWAQRGLALLLLFASSPVWAIVDVSDLHLREPEPGLVTYVNMTLDGSSGNSQSNNFAMGSRIQWYQPGHTHYLLLDYSCNDAGGAVYDRSAFAHYRYIHRLGEHWDNELFLQGEYNPFAKIASRRLAGMGLRYTLAKSPNHYSVYLGSGALYEIETLTTSTQEQLWRGNFYLIAAWSPHPTWTFINSTYLQPALDNPGDLHILEQIAIKIKINNDTAFVINLDIRNDTKPPAGVVGQDIKYGTRIEFKI